MFCRISRALALTTLLLTGGVSCARRDTGIPERLAVVAFENLGSSSALDWLRRASAAAMVADLAGAPNLYVQTVESVSGAYAIQASQLLQGYFFEQNGRLEIRAAVEDVRRRRIVENFEASGPISDGVLPLFNQLARRLNPQARSLETHNPEAFRAYGEALSALDRNAALKSLESATVADPKFVPAYIARVRVLLAAGERDQALKVVQTALDTKPVSIEKAELEYLAASATGKIDERERTLQALARLTPADSKIFRELAQMAIAQRKFQEAVRTYETATDLNPGEAATWNELGYALAYNQDLSGARRALERYQGLLYGVEVNPLDSLGEVSFFLGDFPEAAKYFVEADQRNRAEFGGGELVKAAQAKLLAGDLKEADVLFQRYIQTQRSQRGAAGYQMAQWGFLTGRRKAAISALEKLIPTLDADSQSLALSQLSLWNAEMGDSKAAAGLATQAWERAAGPRTKNLSALCRIIANPPAASTGSRTVDAYALLFGRKYQEALPLLDAIYRETNPAQDGQIRTLLAWALVKSGQTAKAKDLVRIYPIPLSSGEATLASLIFPRYLFVRAMVLQDEGKRAEAKKSFQLFLKYAGDTPDMFGDKAEAQQRVAAL